MGNGMDKIVEGVYVGSIRDSKDQNQLKENNITHILSIHDNATKARADIQYLCIAARDCSSQDLSQYFSQTTDFIHKVRLNNGNVLIHCLAGVSRSVTVTVAYLMTVTSLGWRDALNAVRGARRAANPNFGFQRQLLAFEHEKLVEERQRVLEAYGPNPFPDIDRCRDLLELHREWVLHGDSPKKQKDEDSNTYPLPHKAYSHKDSPLKKEEKPTTSAKPRHTSYIDPTREEVKDQTTVTLDTYLNIKAEKEAKQYLRRQEEEASIDALKARCRSNSNSQTQQGGGAVAAAAAAAASAPDTTTLEGSTRGVAAGGAASAATIVAPASDEQQRNQQKIDELFNSS